jgi:hypothetical protein
MRENSRLAYAARVTQYTRDRDRERQRSTTIARLRLATFLPALAALVWWLGLGGGLVACAAAMVLLLVFGALVVVHARIEDRVNWFDALREVNTRGIQRVDRDWSALPQAPAPTGVDIDQHPYATDLDLFGRASLFQWIGPAATSFGSGTLARWLLEPADPAEILLRQHGVAELAALDDWREQLAAIGVMAGRSSHESIETFLRWAVQSGPPLPAYRGVRVAVYVLLGFLWIPFFLHVTGLAPNGLWGFPLVAGIAFSFFTAAPLSRFFERAGAGERTVRQYASLFAHIDQQPFSAPRLARLKSRLAVDANDPASPHAPAAMRRLNRILGFADLRRGAALLHFPIQAFTLWDFHCLFALESWRTRVGNRVEEWLAAAGELDALACLSAIHRDNPDWCFPEITKEPLYRAEALAHPLLAADRRVSNDVQVGPPGRILLITGSNMSGKSTLLRAIGVNAVLAEAGAPVCASVLRMPPCDIQTSIRIQDSLERGVSYFMAALARLKGVIDAAERDRTTAGDHRRVLFYLLDEILQGTNSAERGIAVQAVAQHLLDAGAIGAMTTHDLSLAAEEPLASHAALVHFTEIVNQHGEMSFDYRLRDGLATSRNALRLMKLIGIDVPQP